MPQHRYSQSSSKYAKAGAKYTRLSLSLLFSIVLAESVTLGARAECLRGGVTDCARLAVPMMLRVR
jgi:hypothetical protein